MKRLIIIAVAATTILSSCSNKASNNPLLTQWDTPFGVPPFDKIKVDHYLPAFEEGIRLHKLEIDSIINNPDSATFDNTIIAFDNSGSLLRRVALVFENMTGSDITPELEKVQEQATDLLTAHGSDIMLNAKLFARIKSVYDNPGKLDDQQSRLVEKIYKNFERSGANLGDTEKSQLREIDAKLSKLALAFGNNLRKDNGAFAVIVDRKEDLAGLSQGSIDAAAAEAKTRGSEGKWAFTLDKSSMIPFLQSAQNRDLRRQLYTGYLERCNHDNETDNKQIIAQMVALRSQRASILGYANHASFVIDRNMAKTPEAVYELLNELWTPALKRASAEKSEMQAIMKSEGVAGNIELWDWWYYAEKLRAQKYALNETELKPYFSLENTLKGLFDLTTKLYGITYRDITKEVPLYNKENQVFEVLEADGTHIGVVYFDFHPRPSKSVGAWCTTFRDQSYDNGKKITPIVSIVCNFTPANAGEPALLTLDEVETLFHEYGHGLHSLFADVRYKSFNSVEYDFVELPSQVMENWACEPDVLRTYAKHYQTGNVIPDSLITKINSSSLFNQGFTTVEYVAASLLDLDYHTIEVTANKIDVAKFEVDFATRHHAIPEIAPRYRSTYFQHIFSGGYSAGYYVYIWAEVLDADAYAAFKESGDIYNTKIAGDFRREILSRGGSADGNTLYSNFRGHAPSKMHLINKRGLNPISDGK